MSRYLLVRGALAVFVVLVVTLLVAWAVRLSGDPAASLAEGAGTVSAKDLENIRRALGLDRPFHEQYLGFLWGMLTGDMGRSLIGGRAVSGMVAQALPLTLLLAALSLGMSLVVSVPLGVRAAVHRGGTVDQVIRIVSLIGLSFPNFWLAIMLVLLFAITLGWLPPSGAEGLSSLVMPVATMSIILSATNVRLVRTAMLETLSAQYVTVARSKGLVEWVVLYKHALRNCAIPLITFIGLQFGGLIGGVVVVERVFSWPGMGSLAFDAVSTRDYPVIQATVTVLAAMIVGVNLLVDVLYALVDPRVRAE